MTKFALIAAVAAALTASAASAATYNYQFTPAVAGPTVSTVTGASDTGPNAATNPDIFTITAGYVTPFGGRSALITQNTNGLGVTHLGDNDPGHIDGSPLFTSEFLSVEFDYAVNLDSFTLQDFENGAASSDDYAVLIETTDGSFLTFGDENFNEIDANYVTGFTIFAVGVPFADGGLFGPGNDEFTFKGFQISSVPLPAGAGLLLGALGLLGYVRRRAA